VKSGELFKHEDNVFYLFRQMLEALAYFHKKGVIHRDLKPGNIFFNQSVRIGDFGLAVFGSGSGSSSGSGTTGKNKNKDGKYVNATSISNATSGNNLGEDQKESPSQSQSQDLSPHIHDSHAIGGGLVLSRAESSQSQSQSHPGAGDGDGDGDGEGSGTNELTGGVGTQLYCAPEQMKMGGGSHAYNSKADLYVNMSYVEIWLVVYSMLLLSYSISSGTLKFPIFFYHTL